MFSSSLQTSILPSCQDDGLITAHLHPELVVIPTDILHASECTSSME